MSDKELEKLRTPQFQMVVGFSFYKDGALATYHLSNVINEMTEQIGSELCDTLSQKLLELVEKHGEDKDENKRNH